MIKLIFSFLLVIAITSCRKGDYQDEECDNAQINLCNNTTDKIFVYGWGTNYVADTLFPGECDLKDMGYFSVKYTWNGDIAETTKSNITLYSPGGTVSLGVTSCYWEYNPSNYQDIAFCYNGVFDHEDDEHDTDCGGKCKPCNEVVIPCSTALEEDVFTLGNTRHSVSSSFNIGSVDSKEWIQFTLYNGETVNFTMPRNQTPLQSKRFIIGDKFWETSVWFADRSGFIRYDALDSQSVYYMVDSLGTESLRFCDVDFERNGQSLIGNGFLTID